MKLTVDASAFKDAMNIAGRVIPTKTPWPIITNLRITAEGTTLTLTGTDAEITFEAKVAAEIDEPGEILVPFAPMSKFTGTAKGGDVKIEADGDKAVIKSGRGRITLSCATADDFPNYPPAKGDVFTVDRESFCHALRFCANAASDEEVRYHINGVQIEERDGNLDIWGTDGKIMNHARLVGVSEIGGGGQMPQSAVAIVLQIAGKADTIKFMICDRGWSVEGASIKAWGRVIEDKYPDVWGLLERVGDKSPAGIVASSEFSNAIDIAACGSDATSENTRHVIVLSSQDGPMILRGHRPAGGVVHAGRAEVDVEGAGEVGLALSTAYLRDAVNGMSVKELALSIAGPGFHVEPREQSAMLRMESLIYPIRTAQEDLRDV